jgi:hypothetical protein
VYARAYAFALRIAWRGVGAVAENVRMSALGSTETAELARKSPAEIPEPVKETAERATGGVRASFACVSNRRSGSRPVESDTPDSVAAKFSVRSKTAVDAVYALLCREESSTATIGTPMTVASRIPRRRHKMAAYAARLAESSVLVLSVTVVPYPQEANTRRL